MPTDEEIQAGVEDVQAAAEQATGENQEPQVEASAAEEPQD